MGLLENTETGSNLFWQIEHNGSWHWEISDQMGNFYIQLSGPTETESHWWKNCSRAKHHDSAGVRRLHARQI